MRRVRMERGFLSYKVSRGGRGIKEKNGVAPTNKEKQVLSAINSGEGNKHVDQAMDTNSATSTPIDVTAGLGSYPTLSEVYGHSPASANAGDTNVVGTVNTPVGNTLGGNRVDVVVPMESIRDISKQFDNTVYGFFLGKRVAYPVVANYDGLSAIATKLGTLLMLDSYTSDMYIQSWGKSSYTRALIEVRADVELKYTIVEDCPRNIGAGEAKKLKKPSQTLRASQEANSSRSSFWNVSSSSHSTTPIVEKINKNERLIIDGKVILVDDEGKPLNKIDSLGDYDSDDEFASVDNEMTSFLAKKDGYGTNSVLEQRNETYENADYDYDP
ncbi:hypothetical protein Tco_0038523 [Tanacetum coccineum]